MSDDNRLEESRLDADHIDRLTRQLHSQHMLMQKIMLDSAAALDVMESRVEKAEADLEAYKARKTSINPWPWRNWRKK